MKSIYQIPNLYKAFLTGLLLSALAIPTSFAQQSAHTMEKEVTQTLQYLLYLPTDYAQDTAKNFPLMLFLHGGGETGNNIELVKKHGPPKLIAEGKDFPFIVLSPQNPENKLWDNAALITLLDEIVATHRVDDKRIYLTGLSRGGFGSWSLAIQNPDRFAALVPICGGGLPNYVDRIKHIPTWVFHGARDKAVPLSNSVEMVEALEQANGNVKLTVYSEAGHDSWTRAYNKPGLYKWLLQQAKP